MDTSERATTYLCQRGARVLRGVERLFLYREALPWSPRPYEGALELRVQAGGVLQVTTWPVIVLPDAEELFTAPTFEEPDPEDEENAP